MDVVTELVAQGREPARRDADRTYSGKFVVRVPPELPASSSSRPPTSRATEPCDQRPPRRLKRSSGLRPPGNAHCVSGLKVSGLKGRSEEVECRGDGRAGWKTAAVGEESEYGESGRLGAKRVRLNAGGRRQNERRVPDE